MRIVNKSILFIGTLFFSLFIVSCNKTLEEEKGYAEDKAIESFIAKNKWSFEKVDGVYHVARNTSYGYRVTKGDTIVFWYVGYTLDGNIFETNVKSIAITAKLDTNTRSFNAIQTIAGKGNLIEGLDVGMLQTHEGEQATILFKSSLGFGNDAIGSLGEWTSLAYDIDVLSVSNKSICNEKSFIESLNLLGSGYVKDVSGLYYKELLAGSGALPAINDTIYGWYKGALPNGSIIEEAESGNAIVLSNVNIPLGVRLGFTLTKEKGATDLVIPSYLGYGVKGNNVVDPYQTVYYQIRLDSIKSSKK